MQNSLVLNGNIFLLTDIKNGKYSGNLTDYEKRVLNFCYEWLSGKEDFLLNTSGSTGEPKLIPVKASRMRQSATMTAKAIGLTENDKSLVCLNTDLIAGKMMLARGLTIGMHMTIIEPASNPLKAFNAEEKFDFTALVPLQLETILKQDPEKKQVLDRMKAILIGGAAVNASLEQLAQTIKAPVYHTFGMTETLSHIALRKLNGPDKSDYFTLLENVSIETDKRNCLVIHSPLSDEAVQTNDIVRLINETTFQWYGRADFIINSGGIKIHPEKIEKELEKIFISHGIFNRYFITGTADHYLGETVTLIIEGQAMDRSQLDTIQQELKIKLSPYELPKKIYFIEKFIETASGKINRGKTTEFIGLKDSNN
jgi:O-succinylbenzoic acid--CoA ligase